jgi:hypothetical protein
VSRCIGARCSRPTPAAHNPDKYDPVDSITRQLKRNLTLLDHRMPPSENLEFSEFQNAKSEQVVGKLYGMRSAVAHGGHTSEALKWLNEHRPPGWAVFDTAVHPYLLTPLNDVHRSIAAVWNTRFR